MVLLGTDCEYYRFRVHSAFHLLLPLVWFWVLKGQVSGNYTQLRPVFLVRIMQHIVSWTL